MQVVETFWKGESLEDISSYPGLLISLRLGKEFVTQKRILLPGHDVVQMSCSQEALYQEAQQ